MQVATVYEQNFRQAMCNTNLQAYLISTDTFIQILEVAFQDPLIIPKTSHLKKKKKN